MHLFVRWMVVRHNRIFARHVLGVGKILKAFFRYHLVLAKSSFSLYLVHLVVCWMVMWHNRTVARHVVGVGKCPAALRTVVGRTDVEQQTVEDDGVTWKYIR